MEVSFKKVSDASGSKEAELARAGGGVPRNTLRKGVYSKSKMFRVLREGSKKFGRA